MYCKCIRSNKKCAVYRTYWTKFCHCSKGCGTINIWCAYSYMTLWRLVPIQSSTEVFYWVKPKLQLLEEGEQMAPGCLMKVILTNIFLLNVSSALSRKKANRLPLIMYLVVSSIIWTCVTQRTLKKLLRKPVLIGTLHHILSSQVCFLPVGLAWLYGDTVSPIRIRLIQLFRVKSEFWKSKGQSKISVNWFPVFQLLFTV